MISLQDNYKELIFNNNHYYYLSGIYYEKGPRGYAIKTAPLGARISILPKGCKTINIKNARYYLFEGAYYNFLPSEKAYILVKKPV